MRANHLEVGLGVGRQQTAASVLEVSSIGSSNFDGSGSVSLLVVSVLGDSILSILILLVWQAWNEQAKVKNLYQTCQVSRNLIPSHTLTLGLPNVTHRIIPAHKSHSLHNHCL